MGRCGRKLKTDNKFNEHERRTAQTLAYFMITLIS
jgi:hypothetical protein